MKTFSHVLLSTLLVVTAWPLQAEMLPTEAAPEAHGRLLRLIHEPEMRRRLLEQGLDAHQAEARLAALTDEEAAALASRFDALPAGAGGGDPSAIIIGVAIFLVIKYLLPYILIGGGFLLLTKAAKNPNASHGSSSE